MGRMPQDRETSGRRAYEAPRVVDLGSLLEITKAHDLFFGSAAAHASDMAMSNPVGSTVTSTPTTVASQHGTPGVGGATGAGGGGAGGGGAGGGGAHGQLPFTGYEVGTVAAIGSALSAAGLAIRRAASRLRP